MDTHPTPKTTKSPTVVTGGGGTPRKKRGLIIFVVTIVVVMLLAVGAFFVYRQITNTSQVNENSETVVDVSSQVNEAGNYPVGSYMWANLMLNAATYASSSGACKQASDIIEKVEKTTLTEEVDVGAARQQVQENCK